MEPIPEEAVRSSFVNASKGEATRMNLPRDFAEIAWADLEFLGWRDPGAPERAWLVAERDGGLLGLSLRIASGAGRGFTSRSMCSICATTHTGGGVALMTARRTGAAGRQGNSIGWYICGDLACPLYVRHKKQAAGIGFEEPVPVADGIARLQTNLAAFLRKVTAQAGKAQAVGLEVTKTASFSSPRSIGKKRCGGHDRAVHLLDTGDGDVAELDLVHERFLIWFRARERRVCRGLAQGVGERGVKKARKVPGTSTRAAGRRAVFRRLSRRGPGWWPQCGRAVSSRSATASRSRSSRGPRVGPVRCAGPAA